MQDYIFPMWYMCKGGLPYAWLFQLLAFKNQVAVLLYRIKGALFCTLCFRIYYLNYKDKTALSTATFEIDVSFLDLKQGFFLY